MHPNLKNLSHSSRELLQLCPTKYRLYKIGGFADREDTIDTNFGSTVGVGVQCLLQGKSRDEAIWQMFLTWKGDLLSAEEHTAATKKKKFFWHTIAALDNFQMLVPTLFKDWEVASFNGKPAVELSFRINFGDEFLDRGHVDVVLRHKVTGELMVLELKTTGFSNITEAQYKNSQQGVGYGVVLDAIAKQQEGGVKSSYVVLYLVYKTVQMQWEPLPFPKTFLQRASWIKSVLMDIGQLQMFERDNFWPKHGQNCYNFFRECEYFDVCGMSDKALGLADESKIPVKTDTRDDGKPVEYTFDLHVLDLLDAQIQGEFQ